MKNKVQASGIFLFVMFLGLSLTVGAAGDGIPDKPIPPRLVNDFTGTLSPAEVNRLEQKLVRFNDTTSTQIVVVLVNTLNGYDAAQFADLLGEKWGVGHKGKDNGIVVLIKPKRGNEKGEAFISTGYGLEGAVPDVVAKRIVADEMIPYFKENRYFEGIDKGTSTLMALTAGEFTADEYLKNSGSDNDGTGFIVFFVMIILFISLIRRSRRRMRHIGGRGGSTLPFWSGIFLGSMMGHSSDSGSWSDFSSGGGSFGGGGFGGGSFGGGGAGGSW